MSDKVAFRKTLGTFSTGVTIITTCAEGDLYGFTANSFTSVSLDPPLVLFCIQHGASFLEGLNRTGCFGINILSHHQEHLSNQFANPALLHEQRFDQVSYALSPLKCPAISGCLSYLDCKKEKVIKAGDHDIVIGRVIHFDKRAPGEPLLYFGGGYRSIN